MNGKTAAMTSGGHVLGRLIGLVTSAAQPVRSEAPSCKCSYRACEWTAVAVVQARRTAVLLIGSRCHSATTARSLSRRGVHASDAS
jgi:hypothetical protein